MAGIQVRRVSGSRPSSAALALLGLGLVLGVSACGGSSRHPRYADGQRAERAGQFYEAAIAYRDACRGRPTDDEACRKAASIASHVVATAMATARVDCRNSTAEGADRCLATLEPARILAPGDPSAEAMAEQAGQTLFIACQADRLAGVPHAMAALQCAGPRQGRVRTPTYDARIRAAATRGVGILASSFAALDPAQHAGARFVLAGAIACLEGSTTALANGTAAHDDLVRRRSIPVAVDVEVHGRPERGELYRGRCDAAAALVEGVRCADDASLRARVDLARSAVAHRLEQREHDLRYQAGVDVVTNPERAGAEERADLAERAHRDAEDEKRERDDACDRARGELSRAGSCSDCAERRHADDVCASAERARAVVDDRRTQRDGARSRLDQTPRTIEQPRFEIFRYVESRHVWEVAWELEVSIAGQGGRSSGTLTFDDVEHVGFDPAGLVGDPLEPPVDGWADVTLSAAAAKAAGGALATDLARRATERRQACVDERGAWIPDWMQCRAEAALWGPEPLAIEPFLGALPCAAR